MVTDEEEGEDGVGRGTIIGEFNTDKELESFLKTIEWKHFTVLGPNDFKYVSISQ